MNQIKAICTIGPASDSAEMIEKLVVAGMDVARVNFSHATFEQYLHIKETIERLNKKHGKQVKILFDLCGPRMRVGKMPDDGLALPEGQEIQFSTDKNNTSAIYIDDPYLHQDIQVGHPIFLANGDMEVLVTKKEGSVISGTVVRGGILFSRKAVNVPETNLTTRGLTEKDMRDIEFGLAHGVEMIAMSFVKDGLDLLDLRKRLNNPQIKIITKLEIKQAMHNLDEIILGSDAIMVARGDLGIELPLEEIPIVQKQIIRRCREFGKPSIVATQMLLSMVNHRRPTRAEVSDVANAVLDGASAVMLSEETANGEYPFDALQYLVKVARKAEAYKEAQAAVVPFV